MLIMQIKSCKIMQILYTLQFLFIDALMCLLTANKCFTVWIFRDEKVIKLINTAEQHFMCRLYFV